MNETSRGAVHGWWRERIGDIDVRVRMEFHHAARRHLRASR